MLETQQEAARRRYLPFITTLHGTDITLVGLDRSYLPITQFGIEQSDGVTAISSYLRDRTREAFNIQGEIEVIRNFVNCDVYVRVPTKLAAMRPRYADGGREAAGAPLELPPGQAHSGCGGGLRARRARRCRRG